MPSLSKKKLRKALGGNMLRAVSEFLVQRGARLPKYAGNIETAQEIANQPGEPTPRQEINIGVAKRMIAAYAQKHLLEIKPTMTLKIAPRKVRIPIAISPPVRKPAVDFYWSDEWRAVRYAALRRSRGVCELCGSAPEKNKPLHVDHIKPRSKYPHLELDPTNLQVLCLDCNLGKSNTDEIDWRKKGTA